MKRTKALLFILVSVLIVSTLALTITSCGEKDETRQIRVKILGLNSDLLFDQDVELTDQPENLTIIRYLRESCARVDLSIDYDEDYSLLNSIGDYAQIFDIETEEEEPAETEEGEEATEPESITQYAWNLYINGVKFTGIKDETQVTAGDSHEWKYEVYVDEN